MVTRCLVALLLFMLRLPVAAQAPAWQSAQAVATAMAAAATNDSRVTATAVDAAGNVYLAGYFTNSVELGGTTITSLGGGDVFVAKFNPASNQFVWVQRAGGTQSDGAVALAVSGASVYVAGIFAGTASFGSTTLTSAGSDDVFVAKITDAGSTSSFTWAQRAGGTSYEYGVSLAVSGTSVYIGGALDSPTADFGTIALTNRVGANAFVAKLSDVGSTGSFVWAQLTGGTDVSALAVSGASVYLTGYFSGSRADFGTITLTNNNTGQNEVFVAKLSDAGNTSSFVWAQRAGGTGSDKAQALALRGTSIYVAGSFGNPTASFGAITLSNPNQTSNTGMGFLASLTDATLTAATAAVGPREPATLFPNPTRRTATLRLPVGTAPGPLTLTDALGRAVRRYPAPASPEATLDLNGLPAGLYLLSGAGPAQRLVVE